MTLVVCIVTHTSVQKYRGGLLSVIAKNRVLSASKKRKKIQEKILKTTSELCFYFLYIFSDVDNVNLEAGQLCMTFYTPICL
jgi:hypothetical protein